MRRFILWTALRSRMKLARPAATIAAWTLLAAALAVRLAFPQRMWLGRSALYWSGVVLLGIVIARIFVGLDDWRAGRLPATRLVLPAIVAVEVGFLLVGRGSRSVFVRALALLELALVAAAVAILLRRRRRRAAERPEDALGETFSAFFPPFLARVMASEIVLFGSAVRFLLPPYRRVPVSGFGYSEEAYMRFLPLLFAVVAPADLLFLGVVVHSTWVRWIITGSDLYAFFWFLGFYVTMKHRPHRVEGDRVELNRGILNRVRFSRDLVTLAQPIGPFDLRSELKSYAPDAALLDARGSPLVEIRTREAVPVESLFRLAPRAVQRLVVSADRPRELCAALSRQEPAGAAPRRDLGPVTRGL
jgi:hypothetical protein